MKNLGLISSLILITFLSGCLNSDLPDTSAQLEADIQKIEKYLDDNNITDFVKDPSGIFYTIHQTGTGGLPSNTDFVNLTYVGKLFNGTTIYNQTAAPEIVRINYVSIAGLQIAIPKFKAGTVATVYIPSVLAFGSSSNDDIPANSNFIFDVTILNYATSETEVHQIQEETIDNYLLEHEITDVVIHPSGMRYKILEEGTGENPTLTNSVSVKYRGNVLGSTEAFDETTTPKEFALSSDLIQGWKLALPLMKEGSKATFYMPSSIAYKTEGFYNPSNPKKSIPGNAILVFDIELLDIL